MQKVDLFAPGFDGKLGWDASMKLKYDSLKPFEAKISEKCNKLEKSGACLLLECPYGHHPDWFLDDQSSVCWEKNIDFQIWLVRFSKEVVVNRNDLKSFVQDARNSLESAANHSLKEFCKQYFCLMPQNDTLGGGYKHINSDYCQRLKAGIFCSGECGAPEQHHHPDALFRHFSRICPKTKKNIHTKEDGWLTFAKLCLTSELYQRWVVKYASPDTEKNVLKNYVYNKVAERIKNTYFEPLNTVLLKQRNRFNLLSERSAAAAFEADKESSALQAYKLFDDLQQRECVIKWCKLADVIEDAALAYTAESKNSEKKIKMPIVLKLFSEKFYDAIQKSNKLVPAKNNKLSPVRINAAAAIPPPSPSSVIDHMEVVAALRFAAYFLQKCPAALIDDLNAVSSGDILAFIKKQTGLVNVYLCTVCSVSENISALLKKEDCFKQPRTKYFDLEKSWGDCKSQLTNIKYAISQNAEKIRSLAELLGKWVFVLKYSTVLFLKF
jgi:hypothetical protein